MTSSSETSLTTFPIPYHLTTVEFAEQIHKHLAQDGIYVMNVVDAEIGVFLRSMKATLKAVFPYVYTMPCSDARNRKVVRSPHIPRCVESGTTVVKVG